MKEIVNQESISTLKKSRRNIIIFLVVSLLATIGLIVGLFFLATRELKYLFIIIFTIIASLEASFILYICVVSLFPLHNLIKLYELSLSGNKFMTKGKITFINDKVTHFKGVAVKEVRVLDLEEENKEYIFYIEQNSLEEFVVEKTYSFVTYQSLITSYEEVI
jgi:hypothetical protein